uniref:Uncharacterized protein n=1 Tax=Glossina pallidipes TaxID=7398 RepID=A0A1B0AEQ5_GLOPL
MMLAKRIACNGNEWSVGDERYFDSNAMNVWQTLEYLSSVNWRKRFNYDGYNDAKNALRMLTPSWRRDSFAEKSIASKGDEPPSATSRKPVNSKYTDTGETPDKNAIRPTSADNREQTSQDNNLVFASETYQGATKKLKVRKKRGRKKILRAEDLDPEYALSPDDYTDLIKCVFTY